MEKLRAKTPSQLRAWFVMAKYSFRASWRNPATIFFGFLFPFVFIAVFGLLGQGDPTYEVAVRADSEQSGPLYEALSKVEVIKLVTDKPEEKIDDELKKGQLPAALVLKSVEQEAATGQKVTTYRATLQTSAAAPEDSQVVRTIFDKVVSEFNNPSTSQGVKLVSLEEEVVEGRKYTRIDFVLPGQLGFALLSTGVFAIAFTFISLREQLVIKRIFATPTKRWVIILGEVAAKMVTALLQATVIILGGVILFNFTLANGVVTFLNMLVLSAIGLVVFLGFGFLVVSIAKDENSVPPLANLITLPQFLLSGTFFPIDVFPEFLQPIARILPMTFLNDAFRTVSFDGAPLTDVLPQLAGLFVWGIIVYVVAVKIFKWE